MSTAFKTQRWVGIKPLRTTFALKDGENLNPRLYLSKLYEALDVVMGSLWSHHLRYEINEIASLLICEDGKFFSDILEQRTEGFFRSKDSTSTLKKYIKHNDSKKYPGHAVVCLFILARAKSNAEVHHAAELCESIAECLGLIETHLNQNAEVSLDSNVIHRMIKRWKQAFPYSE